MEGNESAPHIADKDVEKGAEFKPLMEDRHVNTSTASSSKTAENQTEKDGEPTDTLTKLKVPNYKKHRPPSLRLAFKDRTSSKRFHSPPADGGSGDRGNSSPSWVAAFFKHSPSSPKEEHRLEKTRWIPRLHRHHNEQVDKRRQRQQRDESALHHSLTLMYGHYRKDLGEFARKEAERIKSEKQERRQPPPGFHRYEKVWVTRLKTRWQWFVGKIFGKIGEDWIFLAVLGILMALLSYAMDFCIHASQESRIWLYKELDGYPAAQFFAWTIFPVVFILFSTGFVHLVSPQAIGSGIPEMKTILRGVVLKEYLTFRTLISKCIGLTSSLGSGLPLGKEGPFVHIASIVATLLSKLITSFKGIYENESRKTEMLAAACAVGVGCSFAAPIGGVLFSIEVTSTFFAVRNYWRGFFAAVCGAMIFRLLAVWFSDEETITALFRTTFPVDFPFDPLELLAFSFIGVMCGMIGALFVFFHRQIVYFNRRQKRLMYFLQKNRFVYPSLIAILISSITFPLGVGKYMAGGITTKSAIEELFSNITWCCGENNVVDESLINHWRTPHTNVYLSLSLYVIMMFWMTALAQTIPVPSGVFIPIFVTGAAFGRLVGEVMATLFPSGIRLGMSNYTIVPGGYAVVGAAAMSGSVTHTISTSVIVFELTGQISHILPVMVAVLISNAVANLLQPSFYDSIIRVKRLPFLPDIISTKKSRAYDVNVEDIMVKKVKYVTLKTTYKQVKDLLYTTVLRSFPLVDDEDSMILLGSIQRSELEYIYARHLGKERRLQPIEKRPDVEIIDLPPSSPKTKEVSRFKVTRAQSIHDPSDPFPIQQEMFREPRSILKKSKAEEMKDMAASDDLDSVYDTYRTEHDTFQSSSSDRRVTLPEDVLRVIDLPEEEQKQWEEEQLRMVLDFSLCHIDPAPFQLVERTSLYKVHSLFSLLGLQLAYVTAIGRLVGVCSLKEVRKAIEGTSNPENQAEAPSSFISSKPVPASSPSPELMSESETLDSINSSGNEEGTVMGPSGKRFSITPSESRGPNSPSS